eukprot:Ihof_evm1s482 gene=Ihof_evmTU1s482
MLLQCVQDYLDVFELDVLSGVIFLQSVLQQCVQDYLDVFELDVLSGVIFLQSVLQQLQDEGPQKARGRVRKIVSDPRRQSVVFSNENFAMTYAPPKTGQSVLDRELQQLSLASQFYFKHLGGKIPIVIVLASNLEQEHIDPPSLHLLQDLIKSTKGGVRVLTIENYLSEFWGDKTEAIMLYMSMKEGLILAKENGTDMKGANDNFKNYTAHKSLEVMEAGVKSGIFLKGTIRVDKHRAMHEAWLQLGEHVTVKDAVGQTKVIIRGMANRNRTVHGDVVCVELLPRNQWGLETDSNVLAYEDESQADDVIGEDEHVKNKDISGEGTTLVPAGRVVGVFQRNWRPYTACLPAIEREVGTGSGGTQKVLVVPMDIRIPKIRISTRQSDVLRQCRFVVHMDGWDQCSLYPHGHFVKSLGGMGDIETETAAVLVEYDISVPPFSPAQLAELPTDTPEHPWIMPPEEIAKRKDLRNSHMIFSIDPLGSQDVDDALSIKVMKNGHIQLGVHIADVTHFVLPGTITDLEAKARATTVYLPDRRYDMLPAVLSERLCSLREDVDRFAFSILWELDDSANVIKRWFGKTVIRSSHELHYEYAQALFDGDQPDEDLISQNRIMSALPPSAAQDRLKQLKECVRLLINTTRKLRGHRLADGALELESEEVRFQIEKKITNDNGSFKYEVADVIPKKPLEIHATVAECMIFANHHVASYLVETLPQASLLRHHPLPTPTHFATLIECAAAKGFEVDVSSNKALAHSLNRCVDPRDPLFNKVIRSLATQAMSEAAYFSTGSVSPSQYFHYGLALDRYTHFTSPIRRYADILVHRQLASVLQSQCNVQGAQVIDNALLQSLGEHINVKHRNSKNAQK